MRLIRCILDPLVNRRARINHANPAAKPLEVETARLMMLVGRV
jgi:hypothetical protein